MKRLNTIKNRIVAIILVVCFFAIGTGFTVEFYLDVQRLKADMVNRMTMEALLLGEYCVTALSFNYPERAAEILEKLELVPEIVNGHIYDEKNALFAAYDRPGKTSGVLFRPGTASHYFDGDFLQVIEPIFYKTQFYGNVYLKADTGLSKKIDKLLGLMVVLMLGLLLLSFILATFLQKIVSAPILELARINEYVSATADYSARVSRKSSDEMGSLFTAFNRMMGTIQSEIGERQVAEKELQILQRHLQDIFDSMPSVLIGMDSSGRVTHWNKEAVKVTGVRAGDAHGQLMGEVFPQLDINQDNVRIALESRKVQAVTNLTLNRGDDQRFVDLTIYPLVSEDDHGVVIRVDDVTERVRLEEMMIHSEKMMSLGGLAAGMAHEINNPLGVMMQSSQNILRRLSPNLPANKKAADRIGLSLDHLATYMEIRMILKSLNDIRDAGQRAATIVTNMLQFSRKSTLLFERLAVAEVIDQSLELANHDYDMKKKHDFRRIEICRDYDAELPLVAVVRTELEQVLLNLLKNSAQAMMEAKTQGLQTGFHKRGEPARITLRTFRDDDWVVIEVTDNGPGMSEAVRKRIFEPFYTTKPVGTGTGLGLSVSYMIVTNNQKGRIKVESREGEGATFTIHLPIAGSGGDA